MSNLIKLLIIAAIAIVAIGYFNYNQAIKTPLDENGEAVSFVISSGENTKTIGKNLQAAGLIKSDYYFNSYVKKSGNQSKLQAGEYTLSPAMSIKEIVRVLAGGNVISREIDITTIEGWTIKDIGEYFEKKELFTSTELNKLVGYPMVEGKFSNDFAKEYDFLKDKPKNKNFEGYLFPDTYRIYEDASLEDVVRKMLDNFGNKVTPEMRAEIKKQDKTIFEIVTMASVLEKEVRSEEDMKIVSGIFWDRIKYGQALESCASLAYILGENKPQYTLDDTHIDSPYNLYRNQGLPPGPISNPGIQAIKAAIYPTYTDYVYFLSRPDTGETVFSVTYDEHVNNKAKYLR